jgi:hypothetical protein
LRKFREHGVARKLKLASLSEVSDLPRPWHFEFWQTIPDDLPFTLSHLGQPRDDFNNTNSNNNNNRIEIVISDQNENKSEPIEIGSPKSGPAQMFMSKYYQTTNEAQEVTLPSPSRSR